MLSAQALIAQPQPLIHTVHVIIRLGRVIIPQPAVIIEWASALITVLQLRLRWYVKSHSAHEIDYQAQVLEKSPFFDDKPATI